jgi:excisionase family DNA binding protein
MVDQDGTSSQMEDRAARRNSPDTGDQLDLSTAEFPMTVKEAARFLGISQQTLYVWVGAKQIPHLRVMGRNIRFLQSELQSFRAKFRQEVENGTTE